MSISLDVDISAGDFRLAVAFETGKRTTALLGASGAGKTLTLRAIAGLHTPNRGRIEVNGATLFVSDDHINMKSRDRRVGYVFQDYALFPHLTVTENIAFGIRGASRSERDDAVIRLLDLVMLTHLANRRPAGLSGGERQRVAVARALAPRPRLLLLDEPFSALDAPTREALSDELLALRERIDIPTVLVTHDVSEAFALCDDMVLLGEGHVLQSGPKQAVFAAPSSLAAARLVGVQNVLEGIALSPSSIAAGGLRIATQTTRAPGTRVHVGVRATGFAVTPDDADANATLVQVIDRGTRAIAQLRLDADGQSSAPPVIVELPHAIAGARPRRWRVDIAPGAAMVWPAS